MRDRFRPIALERGAAPNAPKKDYGRKVVGWSVPRFEDHSVQTKTYSSLQDGDDVSLDISQSFILGCDAHVFDESGLSDDTTS
jgi:hypothetical protein